MITLEDGVQNDGWQQQMPELLANTPVNEHEVRGQIAFLKMKILTVPVIPKN
jgi:hypothetical protein